MADVTHILNAIEQGDPKAAAQLLPLVYDELRRLAVSRMAAESPNHSLQPTALVHEAYLRLTGGSQPREWSGRTHFIAAAAAAMRRILIESARRRLAQKRGGGSIRVPLDNLSAPEPDDELLAVHEALGRLAIIDSQKAKLVELRYFAGLTGEQAAAVLGISPATADRHWAFARAWLQAEVRGE